jgi:hypothetical protein
MITIRPTPKEGIIRGWVAGTGEHECRWRFQICVADDDVSACGFAEFSSNWRTRFSHLRGES